MKVSPLGVGAAIVGLVIVIFSAYVFIASPKTSYALFYDYGISIDAGSSHSDVRLYQWSTDKKVTELAACSTPNGIDDFGEDTARTLGQLVPCVERIANKIKTSVHPTPVILGATAGMRLLEAENKPLADKIFADIDKAFKDISVTGTSLEIAYPKILPGEQEGLYAWITANYMLQIIRPDERNVCKDIPHEDTVGILDLGGASAQIAYEAQKNAANQQAQLFRKSYQVKTYSNLCYGVDEARKRYLALIIAHISDGATLDDPCSNNGIEREVTGSELRDDPCIFDPSGNKPTYIHADRKYKFVGNWNAQLCQAYIETLTNPAKCEEKFKICPEISKTSPPKGVNFLAMSSYYYASRTIPKLRSAESLSKKEFIEGAHNFCSIAEDRIKADPDQVCKTKVKFCNNFCFILNFIEGSLKNIYRFEDENWDNIRFVRQVAGRTLGWSLGSMLVQSNERAGVPPAPPTLTYVLPAWAFVILLIGAALLIYMGAIKFWADRSQYDQV